MNKHLRAWATAIVAIVALLVVPGVAQAATWPSPSASASPTSTGWPTPSASPTSTGWPTPSESPTPSPSPTGPAYGCLGDEDSYGNDLPCELTVDYATPVCDGDVPKLQYKVTAVGTPNTTVTLTWSGGGQSVVQTDLPLEGTVLWPGAEVDGDGNPVDWPGWTQLADGTWVEGDEFDWVRPAAAVTFAVDKEATVELAYPTSTSSPLCAAPPGEAVSPVPSPSQEPSDDEVLAATGSTAGPIVGAAAGAVVLGALVVTLVAWLRRRNANA